MILDGRGVASTYSKMDRTIAGVIIYVLLFEVRMCQRTKLKEMLPGIIYFNYIWH